MTDANASEASRVPEGVNEITKLEVAKRPVPVAVVVDLLKARIGELQELEAMVKPNVTAQYKNLDFEEYTMTDKHLKEILIEELPDDISVKPFNWILSLTMFIGPFGGLFKTPLDNTSWVDLWKFVMVAVICFLIMHVNREYKASLNRPPKNRDLVIKNILKRSKGEK